MGGSLRALAICCLLGLAAAPVRAAEVHLRGHWLQVVDDEDSLVGVLSRDPAKVAAAVAALRKHGGQAFGAPADVRNFEAVTAALAAYVPARRAARTEPMLLLRAE